MRFSRLKDLWRGKTLARIMFNEALPGTKLSGALIDIGGVKQPLPSYYSPLDLLVSDVTAVNIDPACGADIVADAAHLPLEDARFEHGLCFNTLEHVADPDQVLREAFRVLKPGATFLVMMPFLVRVHGHPHDYQRWTGQGLDHHLKQAGFQVQEIMFLGGGPFLAALAQVQIVLPRFLVTLVYPGTIFCDWLLTKLRPAYAKTWPLGIFVRASKS